MDSNGKMRIGEVRFYLQLRLNLGRNVKTVAIVSCYGPPHPELLELSSHTYWTVQHLRNEGVEVVDVKSIQSVVMMAPDKQYPKRYQDGSELDRWYMMERPGLKISQMQGYQELDDSDT